MGLTCILSTKTFLVGRYWDFKSLPNDTFFDWPKFKAFVDDKMNITKKFVLGWVENIWGEKEKMLATSIFSFSYNVFKMHLFQSH